MESIGHVKFDGELLSGFKPELIDKISIQNPITQLWEDCEHWGDNDDGIKYDFGRIGKHFHVEVYEHKLRFFVPSGLIFYTDRICNGFQLKYAPRDYFSGKKFPKRIWDQNANSELTINRRITSMFDFCAFTDSFLMHIENMYFQQNKRFEVEQQRLIDNSKPKEIAEVDDELPF